MALSPAGSWAIHYGKGDLMCGDDGRHPGGAKTMSGHPRGLWVRVDPKTGFWMQGANLTNGQ